MESTNTFVKDQFFVEGVISCKFISSVYSDEYKTKIGSDKLKFELTNDPINELIINQLKNKEIYFLKKMIETAKKINLPLQIKSLLKSDGNITITELKNNESMLVLRKNTGETNVNVTSMSVSDKVTNISLKVKLDMNEKIIRPLKSNSQTKLSINELMELIKSENLRLKVRIECGAFYANDTLFISGTLTRINLEQSRMMEVYAEIKEKKEEKTNLLPRDNLYISQFPKKSTTITNNIVDIIINKTNDKLE